MEMGSSGGITAYAVLAGSVSCAGGGTANRVVGDTNFSLNITSHTMA
ncbi:MAG: hypothetical protein LBK13_11770 [Spirochaetales bacterium]|nr:hypothetical protein [Spirochaetales bacterium]